MRISLQEAILKYGTISSGVWSDESKWCIIIQSPDGLHWINTASGLAAGHVYCNRDLAGPLVRALQSVVDRGLSDSLHSFDGCLMIRDVRGEPGKPSTHSYGLAIDINASTNKLGTVGDIPASLVTCFTDQGFVWGGNFVRRDPMHFSLAWETIA